MHVSIYSPPQTCVCVQYTCIYTYIYKSCYILETRPVTLYIMTVNRQYISHVKTPVIAALVTALLDTVLHSQEESSIPATLCQVSTEPIFC